VNSALVPPNVTATPGTINQGQTSSLTSTPVSTGTSPYTYQWFEEAPGAKSYTAVGSSSTSFSFVTSNSTTTGSWSFYLRVTDNLGAAVNSNTVSVTVDSNTLDHFLFGSIGTQTAGTAFSITITAEGPSNNTLTSYTGTNTLSVSIGTISPANTGTFVGGVWTGSVTLTGVGSSVTITTAGSGMSATSGSFAVIPGVLDHFAFSNISTQTAGSAFSITVTAEDASNNTVTSYIGTPSLAYSAGSISPTTMNAFVSGVGSTSVTVTAAGSGVTITATDGTNTGTSNTFTVTLAPTPTPTATPNPTATSSSSPGASPTSTPTKPGTTPTPKPSSIPTPIATTVTAMTGSGKTVELKIRGNVTNLQISNAIISSYQSTKTTLVSFAVTGPSGTVGFVNMTIPKTAIFIGSPEVYIDGFQDTNQGYTQDGNNFYVWFITSFSTHNVSIQFVSSSMSSEFLFGPLFAVGITVPGIISVFTVIAVRRLRRKPDEV
jgi:hypothetical protein